MSAQRITLLVVVILALAAGSANPAEAQSPPEAKPGRITMDGASDRAEIVILGKIMNAGRAYVVDAKGARVKGMDVRVGRAVRDGLPVQITSEAAESGVYGLVLDDGRSRVPVRLEITVASSTAGPEVLEVSAPPSVVAGDAMMVGIRADGPVTIMYLEADVGTGPQRIDVRRSTEVKEVVKLAGPADPGRYKVLVWAVDEKGARSEPAGFEIEVTAPRPVPELAEVVLDEATLAAGTTATVTVRLTSPADAPIEVGLSAGVPDEGPHVELPGVVTVPTGATEVSASLAVPPVSFSGAWDLNLTATLAGREVAAPWALTGTPSVTALDAPQWAISGEDFTLRAVLAHAAPPGGMSVTFDASNAPAEGPWSVEVPAGASEASLTTSVGLTSAITLALTATTQANSGPAVTAQTSILPRPSFTGVYALGGSVIRGAGTGQVKLTAPAPPGGLDVALEITPNGAASVPASVTVPEGTDQVEFEIAVPSPPTDEIVSATLRASAYGSSVENTFLKVWPLEPFLDSLWMSDADADRVYLPTDEVRLFYHLGATNSQTSYGPLTVEVEGGAAVESDPASLTPHQTSGILRLTLADVQANGPVDITVTYGGGTITRSIEVGRPSLSRVAFLRTGVSPAFEITETGYPSNVGCRVEWTLGEGLGAGDLPSSFEEPVFLESDRPDLIGVPGQVLIRRMHGSTSSQLAVPCSPTGAVTEPTVVTVTATMAGDSRTAILTVLPTEATLDGMSFNTPFNGRVLLGQPFSLQFHTDAFASGQMVSLTSSEPDFLRIPDEIPLDEGHNTSVQLTPTEPDVYSGPFPRNVVITAEAGGATRSVTVPVRPWTYLEGIATGGTLHPDLYPGEFTNITFDLETLGTYAAGYTLALSTDRPEVFDDFPAQWVAGQSPPAVTLRLGEFRDPGPVEVTVQDRAGEHRLTLDLVKPTLSGVGFWLMGATDVAGGAILTDVSEVTRVEAAAVGTGGTGLPAGVVDLVCRPEFTLRQPLSSWTEAVTFTTDRPDLIDVQPEAPVTFRGLGSDGVAEGEALCTVDFAAVSGPTTVQVTASYGAESVTSMLELIPAVPSVIQLSVDGGSPEVVVGEPVRLSVALSGSAPAGVAVELSAEWSDPGIFPDGAPDAAEALGLPASADASGLDVVDVDLNVTALAPVYAVPVEVTVRAGIGLDSETTVLRLRPRGWINTAEVLVDDGTGFGAFRMAMPGDRVRIELDLMGNAGPGARVTVDHDPGVFESFSLDFDASGTSPEWVVREGAPPGQYDLVLELGSVRVPVSFEVGAP